MHYTIDFRQRSGKTNESIGETFFVDHAEFSERLEEMRKSQGRCSYISNGMFINLSKDTKCEDYKLKKYKEYLQLKIKEIEGYSGIHAEIESKILKECLEELEII